MSAERCPDTGGQARVPRLPGTEPRTSGTLDRTGHLRGRRARLATGSSSVGPGSEAPARFFDGLGYARRSLLAPSTVHGCDFLFSKNPASRLHQSVRPLKVGTSLSLSR